MITTVSKKHLVTLKILGFKKTKLCLFGLKSTYYVKTEELTSEMIENIKSGETTELLVAIRNIDPKIDKRRFASVKLAQQELLWRKVVENFQLKAELSGKIVNITKGGYTVALDIGINAFLPTSQTETEEKVEDDNKESIIGKLIKCCIINTNEIHSSIVVSEKAIMEKEIYELNKDKLEHIKENEILIGNIKSISPEYLIVNVGSHLLSIVQLENAVFNKEINLSSVYIIGQKIKMSVIEVDWKHSKIFLSINSQKENPITKYKVNSNINVIFYKLYQDTEKGLLAYALTSDHVLCKLSNPDYKETESKIATNESINAIIKYVNTDENYIKIHIKKTKEEIWDSFYKEYKSNEIPIFNFKVIGKKDGIGKNTGNVIFLLYKGIKTILLKQDVAFNRTNEEFDKINIGDKIDAYVSSIDENKKKIAVTRRLLDFDINKEKIETLEKKKIISCKLQYTIDENRIVVNADGIADIVLHSNRISKTNLRDLNNNKEVDLNFFVKNIQMLIGTAFSKRIKVTESKNTIVEIQENTFSDLLAYEDILKEIGDGEIEDISSSNDINDN